MKEIPISEAKKIAQRMNADAVIVIAFDGNGYATTSYGKDRPTCQAFSKVCDQIHDDIGSGAIPIPAVTGG